MNCEAFLDYGTKNERICGNPNAKICDQCKEWFCDEHANEMDKHGDPAKYHTHFICWASQIFEMYDKKKDIPKTVEGVCPRCGDGHDRKKSEQPYLFVVNPKDIMICPTELFDRVCGLCKSELLSRNTLSNHDNKL